MSTSFSGGASDAAKMPACVLVIREVDYADPMNQRVVIAQCKYSPDCSHSPPPCERHSKNRMGSTGIQAANEEDAERNMGHNESHSSPGGSRISEEGPRALDRVRSEGHFPFVSLFLLWGA
jgi:hypothetical protein